MDTNPGVGPTRVPPRPVHLKEMRDLLESVGSGGARISWGILGMSTPGTRCLGSALSASICADNWDTGVRDNVVGFGAKAAERGPVGNSHKSMPVYLSCWENLDFAWRAPAASWLWAQGS